jgi:hypothetical protein
MNTKQLKLLCAYMIAESDHTNYVKKELINYIRHESTEYSLKSFLIEGEFIENLSEEGKRALDEQFELSQFNGITEAAQFRTLRKTYMGHVGLAGYGIPWLIYRKIREKYDVCTKKCGTFELNTRRRQYCMAKCRVEKLKKVVAGSKDPKKKAEENEKLKNAIQTVKDYEQDAKDSGATLNP